jgi:hypothetical protein
VPQLTKTKACPAYSPSARNSRKTPFLCFFSIVACKESFAQQRSLFIESLLSDGSIYYNIFNLPPFVEEQVKQETIVKQAGSSAFSSTQNMGGDLFPRNLG